MKKSVLVCSNHIKDGFQLLEEQFDVTYATPSYDELKSTIANYDAIVSMFNMPYLLDYSLLSAAGGRLKIISNYGAGYDKVDVEAATKLGIVVSNTPDAVTEATAEMAFCSMVSLARNISMLDRKLRDRENRYQWSPTAGMGHSLWGKTLGIIGMGRIGQALARRAVSNGMTIIYHNRTKLQTMTEWMYDARYVSMEELLKSSDVVSLNAPATAETKHIISEQELKAMKPTAYILNSARGTLIDEKALVEALKNGDIAGAALDVYENGDGNITEELLDMDNVVLTPHIGTQTPESRQEIAIAASQNIIRFFEEGKAVTPVN